MAAWLRCNKNFRIRDRGRGSAASFHAIQLYNWVPLRLIGNSIYFLIMYISDAVRRSCVEGDHNVQAIPIDSERGMHPEREEI